MRTNFGRRARAWSIRRFLLGGGATIVLAGIFTPTFADTIETVVVTAERRGEDINKVPGTVQALSGDDLARIGVRDIKTALALIPGASLSGETSQGTQAYQLRGVAVGDTTGDATVASYLDDFAFSIPGVPFAAPANLYDIQRVEVLQGPQGGLYGSSSLGGVIKVVTNDPDLSNYQFNAAASAGAVYGHGYNYSGDVMFNVPLTDNLAVRGVLSAQHLSGYSLVPALGIRNGNNDDTITGRVKVLYKPTDRLTILASFWRFDDQQDFTNRMDGFDPPLINDTGFGNSPTSFTLVTGKITYDLDFATLKSNSGYINRHNGLKALGCQVDTCFDAQIPGKSDSFVQEVRLVSKDDGPLHWLAGYFYQNGSSSSHTFFDLTSTVNPDILIDGDAGLDSVENAVYGQVSYDLWNGMVRPLAGVRYSSVVRSLSQNQTTTISGTPPIVIGAHDTEHGANYHMSPRFNISVYPNDDGMVFINAAQGFRPGALQTASNVAALQSLTGVVTPVQLQTDSLWSYEIGTKWAFFDKSVNVGLSLYMIDWSHAQFQTGLSGISGIINLGDVRGHGVDLSVSQVVEAIPGLSWQFAGSLNSTTIKSINPLVSAALPFLHNGVQIPSVPRSNASLSINYTRPLNYKDMTFVGDFQYQYRAKESDLATGRQSGTLNIVSFEAGIEKGDYRVLAFIDNATDERGPAIWEQGRMIVPRPRTIGLRLAFNPQ